MALDSFPIPAKECWRWRCFLVLGFVGFVFHRNPGVKKIHICDTHICDLQSRHPYYQMEIQNSVFNWNRVNPQWTLSIGNTNSKENTKIRIDETELIYNPGIVGWQSGAKLTHAPLCQHNCLDQQTQIQLQIQIQKKYKYKYTHAPSCRHYRLDKQIQIKIRLEIQKQ